MFCSKTLKISQTVVSRKTEQDRSLSADYFSGFFSFSLGVLLYRELVAKCHRKICWAQSVSSKHLKLNSRAQRGEPASSPGKSTAVTSHLPAFLPLPFRELSSWSPPCSHWRERCMVPEGKTDVQLCQSVVQHMVLSVEFRGCLGYLHSLGTQWRHPKWNAVVFL